LLPDGTLKYGIVYGSSSPCCNQAWYIVALQGGRSYAITLTPDATYPNGSGANHNDFVLSSFYSNDSVNPPPGVLLYRADDAPAARVSSYLLYEGYAGGWRHSYISGVPVNTTENLVIKVTPWTLTNAADYVAFRISVQDTTLYAPWYFTSADYE